MWLDESSEVPPKVFRGNLGFLLRVWGGGVGRGQGTRGEEGTRLRVGEGISAQGVGGH